MSNSLLPHAPVTGYRPDLQAKIDNVRERMGHVPNSYRYHLHRPEIAEVAMSLARVINHDGSSKLDKFLKRRIALVCSSVNGCAYCTSHQCAFLARPPVDGEEGWSLDEEQLRQIIAGIDSPKDEVERVCFDFARAASIDSSSVPEDVYSRLKRLLSPEQIVELGFVVAMWKFYNTLHDSLRFPVDPELAHYADHLQST
jgi:alkylhydroperoxidase family enzyme